MKQIEGAHDDMKSVLSAGPPQVVISPGNSTVQAGSTVVFACVGFGDPRPSVTWSRGGGQLSNNSRVTIYEELVTENGVDFVQSILEICSAGETDGGQYSCTVGNALVNASANFELSVTAAGGIIHSNSFLCMSVGGGHAALCACVNLEFLSRGCAFLLRPSSDCDPSKPDNSCGCWQHYHLCLCGLW